MHNNILITVIIIMYDEVKLDTGGWLCNSCKTSIGVHDMQSRMNPN